MEKDRHYSNQNEKPLLDAYLKDVSKYPLVSQEEERSLGRRIQGHKDPEAQNRLITANLRLVVKIALSYRKYWQSSILDLIQQGNLGLIRASELFDPDKGVKFSHYSAFWIRSYIYKFLIENWKIVKIGTTQNQRRLFFGLVRERERLMRQGRTPDPQLLAERLNVKKKEVIEMSQRLFNQDLSIESGANSQPSGYTFVFQEKEPDVENQLVDQEAIEFIKNKVQAFKKTLNTRESEIFEKRIYAEKPRTLRSIGEDYNISRERVRQIQVALTQRIKDMFEDEIHHYV